MVPCAHICILIITYLNRECLGPIVGGALIYKVGFRSTAAVSHVFNICTYITVRAFDILPSLMPVVDITIQVRIHGFLVWIASFAEKVEMQISACLQLHLTMYAVFKMYLFMLPQVFVVVLAISVYSCVAISVLIKVRLIHVGMCSFFCRYLVLSSWFV